MPKHLYFEDLHPGDRWISPTRVVTEEDVVGFAELTGDFNPLHLDKDFARRSPFGQPIAHGLLGLSFVAGLASNNPDVETVAFLGVHDWRFLKPLFFNDRVHVVTEITETRPHGRKRGRVIWKRALINQCGATVQQGRIETLVARRTAIPRAAMSEASAPATVEARLLAGGV